MRRLLAAAGAASLLAAAPASADLPIIGYQLTGPSGDNGWYVGHVTVKWTIVNDTMSDCPTVTLTNDNPGVQIPCSASNDSGTTNAMTKLIRIDQTAPTDITAAAARAPDSRSWFTAPVGITWSGTDALSGIASCTSINYAGPDATGAAPTGTCRDRAGNISAPVAFSLDYDATPPNLTGVSATAGPGRADIHYAVSADTTEVTVVRDGTPPTTIADGPAGNGVVADTSLAPGTTYTWTVTAIDQAGNAATQRVTATTPVAVAAKSSLPKAIRLQWRRVRRATYYNLQVFQGKRKVLSAWPSHPRFRVAAKWRFRGRTQRLVAGKTYRWYAWAGFGPRSARRYGRMVAHGTFKVPG